MFTTKEKAHLERIAGRLICTINRGGQLGFRDFGRLGCGKQRTPYPYD